MYDECHGCYIWSKFAKLPPEPKGSNESFAVVVEVGPKGSLTPQASAGLLPPLLALPLLGRSGRGGAPEPILPSTG